VCLSKCMWPSWFMGCTLLCLPDAIVVTSGSWYLSYRHQCWFTSWNFKLHNKLITASLYRSQTAVESYLRLKETMKNVRWGESVSVTKSEWRIRRIRNKFLLSRPKLLYERWWSLLWWFSHNGSVRRLRETSKKSQESVSTSAEPRTVHVKYQSRPSVLKSSC
jgi:hypothetical protein